MNVKYLFVFEHHIMIVTINKCRQLLIKIKAKSISTWTTSLYSRSSDPDDEGDDDSGNSRNIDFLKDLACLDILPSSIINLLNSLLVALITSLLVITITRERTNGSKSQQLLTGTHFFTYWTSNYLFDVLVVLVEFTAMIATIKAIDSSRSDTTRETSPLVSSSSLAYVFLLFYLAAFASCSLTYIWSFFFKSEMIGFVVLAILLGVSAFLDMIASFVQIFVQVDANDRNSGVFNLMLAFRYIFMILCPNVTVKRGLYYLKVRQSKYCIKAVNRILNGITVTQVLKQINVLTKFFILYLSKLYI